MHELDLLPMDEIEKPAPSDLPVLAEQKTQLERDHYVHREHEQM